MSYTFDRDIEQKRKDVEAILHNELVIPILESLDKYVAKIPDEWKVTEYVWLILSQIETEIPREIKQSQRYREYNKYCLENRIF